MKTKYSRKIIESDIDVLNHVNYSVYIDIMSHGRIEWVGEILGTLEYMTSERRIAYPLVNLEINYVKETLLGDELTVVTEPKEIGNKSFVLKQQVFNKKNELVADGEVKHVMFNLEDRKSIPVVPEIRQVFENVMVVK